VRVIAGTCKGRRLQAPDWPGLRPTSDRLRETLFNVIAARVEGARVLDGYAGTGAVGIEALSRGARHVTFVERDRRAVALIDRNLRGCGLRDRCTIVARALLDIAPTWGADVFDLVLLDPPYETVEAEAALGAVGTCLAPNGLVVFEHAARVEGPERAGALARVRRLAAGDSALSFYTSRDPVPVNAAAGAG
jgi:16S rRNA (guanine(966)-N(2))-methyltransferase RsmD